MPVPKSESRGGLSADLSVIVVTYNSGSVIADSLRALAEHLPGAEIIVVDNGSEDDTLAIARENTSVRVLAGHGNPGYGAGVNVGARAASGHLLLVLNPDAPVVGVDQEALQAISSASTTGLVGCRIQRGDRNHHLNFRAWGWRGELCWALSEQLLVPRELPVTRPRALGRPRSQWIAGAAFLVSQQEFLDVGGFDASFFLYYEDRDLSRAYTARGLPIRTTDAITVSHLGGASSPRDTSTMTGYCLLGLIQYVVKWEGRSEGRDVARGCLRLLQAIAALGSALGRVPVLGRRARRKGTTALTVRSWLVAAATQSPVPGSYDAATTALRLALAKRSTRDCHLDPA